MKKRAISCVIALLFVLVAIPPLRAQQADEPIVKRFEEPQKAGDVFITSIRHEVLNNLPCVIYDVEVPAGGDYVLQAFGSFAVQDKVYVTSARDGAYPTNLQPDAAPIQLEVRENAWQVARGVPHSGDKFTLAPGRNSVYFFTQETVFPLTDRISITRNGDDPEFNQHTAYVIELIQQYIDAGGAPPQPKDEEGAAIAAAGGKVVPNPAGNYSHELDEAFNYTTYTSLYLTAGTTVTFQTSSVAYNDPVLHLFLPSNPDAYSWSHDDMGSIVNPSNPLDARLTVTIPVTGSYMLLVRPYWDKTNFSTSISRNGLSFINYTPVGGRRYSHAGYNGNRNFFTGYKTGDPMVFTLNGSAGHVRGYNDDYPWYWTGANFNWGLNSRVKKNFPSTITTTFVSSWSPSTGGTCDTYMGNLNGTIYGPGGPFPLLKADDDIQSAPTDGWYNCISWSGGITYDWIWPPSDWRWSGGSELASFDRYYANIGTKRYSGAWNITRSGANVSNSIVDLWKIGSGSTGYTHASVKKPGNNNPHGYDWESKPGGLERTFHPRNDLAGAAYGSVTNYYRHNGTYAPRLAGQPVKDGEITSDADAVRLGYDVYDKPGLTPKAQQKLAALLAATNPTLAADFNRLYDAWKADWVNHAVSSNPNDYAKSKEYDALFSESKKAGAAILPLLFDRYLQGDFLATPTLWTLTETPYAPLMEQVKQDVLNKPTDEKGRFILRSTFGMHVYYIEKILNALPMPAAAPEARFTASVSPNPFKDRLNIEVKLDAESKVSITAASAQTGGRVTVLRETTLPAGTHRYTANARQFAGSTGDIISVQVQVNGITQTVKAIAGQ